MPFITQGKTNLKYILIVVILVVIVGGGVYLFSKGEMKLPEVQPPETQEVTAELLTSCITDADCERYIVYNQCKVYCANKDEANLQIIKKLEETKLCDPTLWFTPPLNCGCVNNQCVVKQEEKTEDETADWQTYKNEEYGFEIKYPPDFTEQKAQPDMTLLAITKTDRGSSYSFGIYVIKNYKVEQIISTIEEAKEINVGDHLGYEYFYIEGAGMSEVVLIQIGQDALSISFNYIGNGQNFATANDRKIYVQDFFNQIFSTFKFIK